ncbi:LacI family DNA-binding transcriptional regulator [Nocardioides bruguierae]|uniref:LacI family transcriptional regulator n=1 Tax=Nocardioides bruguierae TaxID=2945102 RepID=A0A9X2ID94_9ACTN|nr:LacI family DNA-binding transcriptional regulator [Nocardioides bruguierae]MCM0618788.1 LacI family transcriptional regulator [Nocardioides bruguierae]
MSPTMHDVARLAGVSIKTVSNVVNDYPHIRESTRERVRAAIAELDYVPNKAARNLRSGRSGAISLVMPDLRNPYFAELADDVMRAAAEHGLTVLIEQLTGEREQELQTLHGLRQRAADGVIYSVLNLDLEDADQIDVPVPLVLLGDRIFHGPADHVTIQNAEGAKAATEHLLERGRRRLLALGAHEGEVLGSAGLRLHGYREALEAAGVPFDPDLVTHVGRWHRVDGAEAMREVVARGVTFDGVVAFNDSLALGAMRVLLDAGLRVPEDVAIIGFDDVDETRYSQPTLSTIDPGRAEIARRAVEVLVERMNGLASPPREIAAPFSVVARESTATG